MNIIIYDKDFKVYNRKRQIKTYKLTPLLTSMSAYSLHTVCEKLSFGIRGSCVKSDVSQVTSRQRQSIEKYIQYIYIKHLELERSDLARCL